MKVKYATTFIFFPPKKKCSRWTPSEVPTAENFRPKSTEFGLKFGLTPTRFQNNDFRPKSAELGLNPIVFPQSQSKSGVWK